MALRVPTAAAVFAYKKVIFIRHDPITSAASRDLYLIPQVYFIVLKQLYGLPVWKRILQINIKSVQQIQVIHMKIFDPQRIKFPDQRFFIF